MRLAIVLSTALALSGTGFWVGRHYPLHHYQDRGHGLLMDTATGKVCNPVKDANDRAQKYVADHPAPTPPTQTSENPFAWLDAERQNPTYEAARDPVSYIPQCGQE